METDCNYCKAELITVNMSLHSELELFIENNCNTEPAAIVAVNMLLYQDRKLALLYNA